MRPVFVVDNQHRRWELNDPAGRLDSQTTAVELCEGLVPPPARSVSGLSPDGDRMLPASGELPEDSGRSSTSVDRRDDAAEAAQVIGVSAVTVKQWLSRGLRLVNEQLADLRPGEEPPDAI